MPSELKPGQRVRIDCPWKKKVNGQVGNVDHQNHKLVWVRLDSGKTVATKAAYLKEPDILDRLADVL